MTAVGSESDVRTTPRAACLGCGTEGQPLYGGLEDRLFGVLGRWNLFTCPNKDCGLAWLNPMPIEEDLAKLYKQYYTHSDSIPGSNLVRSLHAWLRSASLHSIMGYGAPPRGLLKRVTGRLLHDIGLIRDSVASTVFWLRPAHGADLLDVGCGSGAFAERMRALGWRVIGVEPDEGAAGVARAKGLRVWQSTLEDAKLPASSVDVITMSHVIEHLPNPVRTLEECRRILRSSGLLLLITPNAECLGVKEFGRNWVGWDPPRHLHIFTVAALQAIVQKAGFRFLRARTTARTARESWCRSRQIRATGRAPGLSWGFKPWLWPPSLIHHLAQHRQSAFKPVAEEILLCAAR